MKETVERIGVCQSRNLGIAGMFHRVKIKLSRKFRVWPVGGSDSSILLDPSEYTERYRTIGEHKVEHFAESDKKVASKPFSRDQEKG